MEQVGSRHSVWWFVSIVAVLVLGVAGPAAAATPTLTTTASPSVPAGGQIHDTATLSEGAGPTGTIVFDLYGPDNAECSAPIAFSSSIVVNGNGVYNSDSFTTTMAGTYRWRAQYSGDPNNTSVGTSCSDPAEQVVVTGKAYPLSVGAPRPPASSLQDLTPELASPATSSESSSGAWAAALGLVVLNVALGGTMLRRRRLSQT
jgi:hypothetical protein